MEYGFFRTACVSPELVVAGCTKNALNIIDAVKTASNDGVELLVFPELSITGATCGDLFNQDNLLNSAKNALLKIVDGTKRFSTLFVVGCPLVIDNRLFDCGVFIQSGKILGIVPKTNVNSLDSGVKPGLFASGDSLDFGDNRKFVEIAGYGEKVVFGKNLLISCNGVKIACEIGSDFSLPVNPGTMVVLNGADIIVNLASFNQCVGQNQYKKMMVEGLSSRLCCGYVLSDSGKGESTTDMVFSGYNLIGERGKILAQSELYTNGYIISEIDVEKLRNERRKTRFYENFGSLSSIGLSSTDGKKSDFITIECEKSAKKKMFSSIKLVRRINPYPFTPLNKDEMYNRCKEIVAMQSEGLAKRLTHTRCTTAVLGLSGGLDSTLALLITFEAFRRANLDYEDIIAVTMPCFGTTDRTYKNACDMAKSMGVTLKEVPIEKSVLQHFEDIGQDENNHDVTYENAQARERTQILMDIANQAKGIVVGTGDLSELALGWATYSGDQMSMYGVNASIPKTLVRHLVEWFSNEMKGPLSDVLKDILATPVSPELLPPTNGTISQKTEELVGPYDLHDFFIYHTLRHGFSKEKIAFLAYQAFIVQPGEEGKSPLFGKDTIDKWLNTFYRRFYSQQFKRSCMPDGARVGTLSFSPRGSWSMPSDAVWEG